MKNFNYHPIFKQIKDPTIYKKISFDKFNHLIESIKINKKEFIIIDPFVLTLLAQKAFFEVSHFFRPSHLNCLQDIINDPESSNNDKFVAQELIENAIISKEGILPFCQDTGTAIINAQKGEQILTLANDKEYLSKGIYQAYQENNLRYSQLAPISMYEEVNTKNNLPAQIDIYTTSGTEYNFLFIAKGGGSANKTFLYQKTKAILNPGSLEPFLKEITLNLGTAACPPYHLAIVIGGSSAEENLKTVKLASCKYYDNLPTIGNNSGQAFRDITIEEKVKKWTQESRIGAQFGGKYLVHDVRVIRLPRHSASCPIGIGVSCSADRNMKAKINKKGVFLEKLEHQPEQYLTSVKTSIKESKNNVVVNNLANDVINDSNIIQINLNEPIQNNLNILDKQKVSTRVSLNGPMIVARDTAHAKIKEYLDKHNHLPDYFKNYVIYYAGPAKTPINYPSGSFGPTTSSRMDPYIPIFQSFGGSLITLGKGNRSPQVTESCKKNNGFYLGSIGGAAAKIAKENIKKVEVIAFPELGMEAIWKIEVKNFPAFIITDNKGNDFFSI